MPVETRHVRLRGQLGYSLLQSFEAMCLCDIGPSSSNHHSWRRRQVGLRTIELRHEASSTAPENADTMSASWPDSSVLSGTCTRRHVRGLTSGGILSGGTARQEQRQQLVRERPGALRVAQLVQLPECLPATSSAKSPVSVATWTPGRSVRIGSARVPYVLCTMTLPDKRSVLDVIVSSAAAGHIAMRAGSLLCIVSRTGRWGLLQNPRLRPHRLPSAAPS